MPREFQLAPSLAMVQCPRGYRSLQPQDLAVGKDVLYISRNPDTSQEWDPEYSEKDVAALRKSPK